MKDVYNVLIIGAGQISAFFDKPGDMKILTHAHAFTSIEGFNLLGFYDTDFEKASEAAEIWNVAAFKDLNQTFEENTIDVVVAAVPDQYHYPLLVQLSQLPVKAILAEKPLTRTIKEASHLLERFKVKPIGVAVNYSRRYVKEFNEVRRLIQAGSYGRFLTGHCYYGKGIIHNGSHCIDFIRYMLGTEVIEAQVIRKVFDFYDEDPSVSAVLKLDNQGSFFMQPVDCSIFTLFEIELIFERNRLRFVDSGHSVEVYEVQPSKYYMGYRSLYKIAEIEASLDNAMQAVANNILEYLKYGKDLICTLEDGYKALEVCEKMAGENNE